jgi:hydrogenase-4 component B
MNFDSPSIVVGALAIFGIASLLGLLRSASRVGVAGVLSIAGCALCLLSAFIGKTGLVTLPAGIGLAGTDISFVIDPLSRWFLGLIGVVGLPICIYLPGYLQHLRGRARPGLVWSGLALLFASMAGVVIARNALVFFAFWELMALSSFLLVATEHERQAVRRAAFIYLGATRIGSAFLMAGFLWAHAMTGSWNFQEWIIRGGEASGPAALILVGLLTKAGSWPFHLWLPIAHPAAPGPVSALMSGVMIKTAIYAIFRLFLLGGIGVPWMGWALIAAGAVSAFWGVLFALLQHDLKRLLAYHSVENIGLILLAAGISLVARGAGLRAVSDVALAAGLFHTLNHGIFKALLFLCAGIVDANAHTRELDRLGGLIHRMPWTAAMFFVGSAAICALPPLNGFASEWLLYKGLFQMGASGPSGELRLVAVLLLGWVGLVGALALACFGKAFGICFLGQPRSREAAKAREAGPAMAAACGFLAVLCAALGLGAPRVWQAMFDLGFVQTRQASGNSLPIIPMTIAGLAVIGVVWATMTRLAKWRPARQYVTWDCGFGALPARAQYTAASFAQPIVRLFGALYRYEMEVAVEGKGRRHFPTEVRAESRHEPYLESRVYSPALGAAVRLSEGFIMRLQAGSIHQYLMWMVITLGLLWWLAGVL